MALVRTGPTSLQHEIEAALSAPADPVWSLSIDGYQPAHEHDIETRLVIGNGVLGVRGSLDIPTSASRPRTFVAGLFDTTTGDEPRSALVPGPDWLRLAITVGGTPLTLDQGVTMLHRRTLDLRRGVLLSDWLQRVPTGQTIRLRTLRWVSLANCSLALHQVQISVDQPISVTLEARLASPEDGLEAVPTEDDLLAWRTHHSQRYLAAAICVTLDVDGQRATPMERSADHTIWHWHAQPDQPVICVRAVALARGPTLATAQQTVRVAINAACRSDPLDLLAAHEGAWAERWAAADIVVDGDDAAQRALRFALYHLISAANPDDPNVSIGARALTGDAYQGHVFWDTEIFLLPFYTLTWPEAAGALLQYRWLTLPAAREKARRLG